MTTPEVLSAYLLVHVGFGKNISKNDKQDDDKNPVGNPVMAGEGFHPVLQRGIGFFGNDQQAVKNACDQKRYP